MSGINKFQNAISKPDRIIVFLFLILLAIVIVRSAWVCDDAYITLRTVDNLYHGYGLTWNIGERVQTYTHPLWMLLIAAVYPIVQNPYHIILWGSILVSLSAIWVLTFRVSSTIWHATFGILMLIISKAFIDYSTSGLENPLTYLLYIVFIFIYLKHPSRKFSVFYLALTVSLGVLNRMDTIFIFLPPLIYALNKHQSTRKYWHFALGFLPFLLWEIFALYYYGFPFPNTAYAKLNTGINSITLVKQGILYIFDSLSRDPGSLAMILLAGFVSIVYRDWRKIMLSSGILLYLLYIIAIGGDFMSGRYLSALVLGAVAIITHSDVLKSANIRFAILIGLILLILATPDSPVFYNANDTLENCRHCSQVNGIQDERRWYYGFTGLLTKTRSGPIPQMKWVDEGKYAKENNLAVVHRDTIGLYGYYAGPEVHIVDWYGLSDPLLARLPMVDDPDWRVGHYERELPIGYLETLETGENQIQDPNLANFYDKLVLVTRGKLTDRHRIVEIVKLNLGYYDAWLNAYIHSH